jgi:proline dehydrogenase
MAKGGMSIWHRPMNDLWNVNSNYMYDENTSHNYFSLYTITSLQDILNKQPRFRTY